MSALGKLLQLVTTAFVLVCIASVAAQAVGVSMLWSRGALTQNKIVRYTGVLYGLDPLNLSTPKAGKPQEVVPESREEILADRVMRTPLLADRVVTITKSAEDIRGVTLTLKRNRQIYVEARDQFESLLDEREAEIAQSSLRELQITLELATPKQAKEILRSMLSTTPADAADNVMKDVVNIIKLFPPNKLKKILAEFKSDDERKLLHRIMVEIGELDERPDQLTGKSQ